MSQRIHITSMLPRSGTTLLNEMMAYAFDFNAIPEHELSVFDQLDANDGWILTKKPHETRASLFMLSRDPDLKLIYIDRDIRDVLCSKHGKDKKHYWTSARTLKYQWKLRSSLLGNQRVLFIKYESLIKDTDSVEKDISNFLGGVYKKRSISDFYKTSYYDIDTYDALGGLRPLDTKSIGVWKDHLPWIKYQLVRYPNIQSILVELGYEKTDDWIKQLDGINESADGLKRKGQLSKWWRMIKPKIKFFRGCVRVLLGRRRLLRGRIRP